MPLFDETTAQQVYDLANLTPQKLGMEDRADVLRHINRSILPKLNAIAQTAADDAVAPHDFPLTSAVIAEARGWTSGSDAHAALIQDRINAQSALWQAPVMYRAAGELLLGAKTSGNDADEIRARAELYFDLAEKAEAKAIQSAQRLVAHTEASEEYAEAGGIRSGTVRSTRNDGYSAVSDVEYV